MGSCASTPTNQLTSEQVKRKEAIEARASQIAVDDKKVIKLLLLGAGECGKSTILKQMKILHCSGFEKEEEENYRQLIFKNVLESIQTVCQAMLDLKVEYEAPQNEAYGLQMLQLPEDAVLEESDAETIKKIWDDEGIQKVLDRGREFHLLDSAPYFLDYANCVRILAKGYAPTHADILRCRLATTGIHETKFIIDNLKYRMFDVGGQRGERKMWIHCFENVTAIMYIASLIEYDQVLAEDRKRNRLEESLALFTGIINLPWFKGAAIILFLNKKDLFVDKIKKVKIAEYFPDYKYKYNYEDGNEKQATKFIMERYLDKNLDKSRTIYVHATDATNTENIHFVWKCTRHIILEKNLQTSGLSCSF